MTDASSTTTDQQNRPNQELSLSDLLSQLEYLRYQLSQASRIGERLAMVAPQKLLVSLLKDKKAMMQFAAAEALRFGNYEFTAATVDLLLSKIDDQRDFIAAAAIRALGEKRIEDAKAELLDCVDMQNLRISCAALQAVTKIDPSLTKELIQEFLDSEDPGRVAAAANVIERDGLVEYAPRLLELAENITAMIAPDIPADEKWTPERKHIGDVISALSVLKHEPAIPLLQKLGSGYVGLRTHALNALNRMGVDVSNLVETAIQQRPSRGLRGLMKGIAPEATPGYPVGFGNLASYRETNQVILKNAVNVPVLGAKLSGRAVMQRSRMAIIELSNGLHGILRAEDLHWTRLRNLTPYTNWLEQHHEFIVTEVKPDTGYVAVSYREIFENPWSEDSEFLRREHVGKVESILRFGALVDIGNACVGLLHASQAGESTEQSMEQLFPVGKEIRVRIESTKPDDKTMSLVLA